jgi:flagellar assembly protein FliH
MAHVVKTGSPATTADVRREVSGLAGFNLSDLADEGRLRLDECRRQISEMLAQAKEQAEAMRSRAVDEGYAVGIERAQADLEQRILEQAEIRARDGLQLLTRAVQQLHEVHDQWMQSYAEALTRLTIAAAERVIANRLDHERNLLVQWAGEAVRSTRTANRLTIAVHPETLAELGAAFDQLLASPDLTEQTLVEADESVDRNSVVVRQPGGEIHAGLLAQLRRLEELLP